MTQKIKEFQHAVYSYYRKHKRTLPWRETRHPYKILVSEMMLQQTQVSRVLIKYQEFLTKFPTVQALAQASLRDVLSAWQGLGYNRRAKYLHQAVKEIVSKWNGKFPHETEELKKLPGIGTSTASAVVAFAYNKPVVFIETNIRSVFIHHFFADQDKVSDKDILPLVKETLDKENPRDWYYALMDYGVYLKKLHKNPSRRSSHHVKQSRFEGSNRQLRGAILRALLKKTETLDSLSKLLKKDKKQISSILSVLEKEGLVRNKNGRFLII